MDTAVAIRGQARTDADTARAARRRILGFAAEQTVHLGSSLSVVDLLVAVLREAATGPAGTGDPNRERVLLSKGHAVWALYAVLAELGRLDPERLGPLAGHPADQVPGVDAATGALGHGLSIGAGLAEATRLRGRDERTFVVLGDGELNEGSVWEAVMFAAHRRLGRLVALVDRNGMQQEGATADVLDLSPLAAKWRSFGWRVREVDGHDHAALREVVRATADPADRPVVLLARTVKGKGVPFMEHSAAWHTGRLDRAQLDAALAVLGQDRTVARA
ncbi:transketolase [Streptacidiphilus sp. MAP12-20]|uniref:transketolase n=1 Tax=Streptacidiphilus sp. MAP12-20 TaxID=3156299 RepID=UPI0035178195